VRHDAARCKEVRFVNNVPHSVQRGDIFLNLHPDWLGVVNPGSLPLGVTPQNVLHTSVRRNEHLARVFHDLKLMEREGSGFDRLYEVLLSQGRPAPELREGPDRVEVTIRRRILRPEVIDFMTKADQAFRLTQRERITLGLLAQRDALTARELAKALTLPGTEALGSWMGRLQELGVVRQSGRTTGVRCFVEPKLLRDLDFTAATTLRRIEPHRLRALILTRLRLRPTRCGPDERRRLRSRDKPECDRLASGTWDREAVSWVPQDPRTTGASHEHTTIRCRNPPEHVTLEVESIDRMYLNVYIPKLQCERGVVGFFRYHRGHPFASSVSWGRC